MQTLTGVVHDMSFECVEAVSALATKLKAYSTDRQASATGEDPPQTNSYILQHHIYIT